MIIFKKKKLPSFCVNLLREEIRKVVFVFGDLSKGKLMRDSRSKVLE
jgi:hypothetical protein